MSIRPVDLQIMLPRASEAAKLGNADSQRPEVMQQQFTEKMQKQVQQDEQRVLNTNKSEHDSVDKDGKGGSNQSSKKRQNRFSREQDESDDTTKPKSMFDVSI